MSGNIDWSHLSTAATKAAAAKQATIEAIASARYDHETAGTTASGVAVFTDRTTQMKLTGAAIRAERDPSYSVDWKQSDGTYVELSAVQLIAIADAVGDYVQACYSREAVLLAALADGSYTDAMLVEGWPS